MNDTTDRFQPGHTYTRTLRTGDTERFQVEHITTRPGGTQTFAFGWRGGLGAWYGCQLTMQQAIHWTDTTPDTGKEGSSLPERIAAAIRRAACDGDCEETEEWCARTRIQPSVWHHGVLAEVSGPVDVFAGVAASAVVPAADRAALRDRIAEELAARFTSGAEHTQGMRVAFEGPDGWPATRMVTPFEAAEAVLAVLPAPADRAAVLREVIERVSNERFPNGNMAYAAGAEWMVTLLERIAAESAVVDRVAAETPPAETHVELQVWPLQRILTEVRCGSEDWPWEEEWADLDRRHAETGYLDRLTEQIRENGITMPVLIGSDGRLWDGHHRLCVAARLGIGYVPVEIVASGSDQPGPVVPAQSGNDTTTPSVGYTGKGRVWCLTCPRPADENVPATIDIVRVGELCAGCGRDVVELARATEQPKKV
ncbi:ParB N-terminal domain-containing protein [Streptomyces caniscabiei]|uniref:ParB N-terminal domain-containing protein n=1 Tax=Streptomyces caniscabiei TaxID=2746961 RepID=UPI0018727874|nr:ParB N-terminal domain-containing protein [Streptomyces caniscabiei]MBE4761706.1 ParB N-terminal domain-containing protein [Streptomyces caniscabiei]